MEILETLNQGVDAVAGNPPSGPRKKSLVWDNFTRIPDSEASDLTAACNYCCKSYHCDPKSHGTTSMLAHSKICPQRLRHLLNEACRKALAKLVLLDEQPFRLIESESFRHLCRTLQPQFDIPSKCTIIKDCFRFFPEEKARLRSLLMSEFQMVSIVVGEANTSTAGGEANTSTAGGEASTSTAGGEATTSTAASATVLPSQSQPFGRD